MHVVGTAGHVDHGKSTLVHALTGIDPDRFEEEKRRGLTIDLGFAWLELPSGREVGIVDVPGHERFIRNMLAGVGGIDAALFVVAADEGWMPQSAEHLLILDFLGVSTGVVVVTKTDLVEPDLLELVREEIFDRVRGTALHHAPLVEVSAATGSGLDTLRSSLDDVLAASAPSPDRGRPRLFVDRSFTITGAGTVVTGTLTGGRLRTDDEVEVVPGGGTARIRSLQTHRRTVDEATPGSRVAVNLVGLARSDVARGDAVVTPGRWQLTDRFAGRLRAAADIGHSFVERGAYELHVGSVQTRCRFGFLEEDGVVPVQAEDGRLVPGLPPGADVLVRCYCDRPIPLDVGDRFIVRDLGRWDTVAGGVVLDQAPGRLRRGDAETVVRLRSREGLERPELAARILAERGILARTDLARLAGSVDVEVPDAVATPTLLVDATFAERLRERARTLVDAHHRTHPLDAGMGREALRHELGLEQRWFAELLDLWLTVGTLAVDAAHVRLPEHGGDLSPTDRARADRALAALRTGGVTPPDPSDLDVDLDLLKALERRGEVVFVAPAIVFAADVLDDVIARVSALVSAGPATVSVIRDAIGTTRKFAVPLLEHLDRAGSTKRKDDTLAAGPRA